MRLKKVSIISTIASMAGVLFLGAVVSADEPIPGIFPSHVEALVFPGEAHLVDKTVRTPPIPPKVDVCLLEDESGSFVDDIANLQAAADSLFDSVRLISPDSQFAVAGFRDYPISPFGAPGDWVYRRLSGMSPNKADWLNGVSLLTANGGNDIPEAQFDGIVAAAGPGIFHDPTLGDQPDCGWRADPTVTRVLVVATDAPFHVPGPGNPHMNDLTSTIAALQAQGIVVIGLEAPGTDSELDSLASATGGSVQPLSSDGSNIASAIVAGLTNLVASVKMVSDCSAPLSTTFEPPSVDVVSGGEAHFTETIAVAVGALGGTYTCKDWALINGAPFTDAKGHTFYETKKIHVPGISLTPKEATNELKPGATHAVLATVLAGELGPVAGVTVLIEILSGPNAGKSVAGVTDANGQLAWTYPATQGPAGLGTDNLLASFTTADGTKVYGTDWARKHWKDTTPPDAVCRPTVNPHGQHIPNAPGNGGQGQNQDGFYQLLASDLVWPKDSLQVFVTDSGSGTVFGPFPVGTNIKYTQAPGATPVAKPIGSSRGSAGAVSWHITGKGDALVTAVDGSGNTSAPVSCRVPPPPK
jgi:hypothetical protein